VLVRRGFGVNLLRVNQDNLGSDMIKKRIPTKYQHRFHIVGSESQLFLGGLNPGHGFIKVVGLPYSYAWAFPVVLRDYQEGITIILLA
jgi:hypothetical protein